MLISLVVLLSLLIALGAVLAAEMALLVEICLFAGVALGAFLMIVLILFLLAWVPSLILDPEYECHEDSKYFRMLVKYYAPAVFTFLRTKIQITGMEKMPAKGRFMLVCNHIADLDSGVMLAAFRNYQLGFLAKKETKGYFFIGSLMSRIGCQFIDRENDRNALKSILNAIRLVKEDKVSMMGFPEGAIIEDGRKLHHFRSGIFKVAMKPQVPVVVCTIRGTPDILPNIRRLKPSVVDLRILDVVSPEEYAGWKTPQLAERVYDIMRADLGPEADGSL